MHQARWIDQVTQTLHAVIIIIGDDRETRADGHFYLTASQAKELAGHRATIQSLLGQDDPSQTVGANHRQRNLIHSVSLGLYVMHEHADNRAPIEPVIHALLAKQVRELIVSVQLNEAR